MLALPDELLMDHILRRCNPASLCELGGVNRRLRDLVRQTHEQLALRADAAAAVAAWPAPCTCNIRALVLHYSDSQQLYGHQVDDALQYPGFAALLKGAATLFSSLTEVAMSMSSMDSDSIRPGNAALAAQLQLLAALPSLRHLQLRCSAPPPPCTLAALAGLSGLTSLVLQDKSVIAGCTIAAVQLCLTRLSRLRGLALDGIWPANLAPRAWLPDSVTSLVLRGYRARRLCDDWLPALAGLSKLQSLQLLQDARDLVVLGEDKVASLLEVALALPGLTQLEILTPQALAMDDEEDERLAFTARLPAAPAAQQLAVLRVDSFPIALASDEDWRRLASLACLREAGRLSVVTPPPAGLVMHHVTSLQLMHGAVTTWSFSTTFPGLAALSLLMLWPHELDTHGPAVAACTGLTRLALQLCSAPSGADRSTLVGLGQALPALHALSLAWGESMTDTYGLPSLAGFSALTAITLCQALGRLPDFATDEIRDSHVLAALAPLRRLRSVRLEGLPSPTPGLALGLQALLPALTNLEAACCYLMCIDVDEEHALVQAALRPGMRLLLLRTSDIRLPIEQGWPFDVEHLAPPRYDAFRRVTCKYLPGATMGE